MLQFEPETLRVERDGASDIIHLVTLGKGMIMPQATASRVEPHTFVKGVHGIR